MTKFAGIKSDRLKECVDAFILNLNRTATFAVMPSELAFMVRRDQIFSTMLSRR